VTLVDKPSVAGQAMDFNFLSMDEADRLLSWRVRNSRKNIRPMPQPSIPACAWASCGACGGLTATWTAVCSRCAGPTDWPPSRASRARCPSTRRCCRSFASGGMTARPRMKPWSSHGPRFMRQKDRDYGFKAALTGAECHAVTFHGLRHTFASHFMMSGGNILTLQKLLGHSSVAVTMKYAHLAPDFMRDEIARLRFERPAAVVTNLAERRAGTG